MISEVLTILRDTADDFLSRNLGQGAAESGLGHVVFTESEKADCVDLKLGAVTLLLVNVEHEHALRPADPYRRTLADGSTQRIHPPIFLNAYVLFVARVKDYQQSLTYISLILSYFLSHPVLDHTSTPALSARIEKLSMELVTLSLAEQNNLWGILRSAYQPSLLYKVRMIAFQDEEGVAVPPIQESTIRLRQ